MISNKLLQPQKASSPIISTPSGILTFLTALFPNSGIHFKLAGKMISALQFSNTPLPNDVSSLGNVILSKDVQLENAELPIVVIESEKAILVNAVQFSNA